MDKERECKKCKHYLLKDGKNGCESWECKFEPKDSQSEGGLSDDAKHIIHLIDKYFDVPCTYEYGDIDAYDFCNSIDENGVEWCEAHCGQVSSYDCWYRFFELVMKAEKEQIEYGGGPDAD